MSKPIIRSLVVVAILFIAENAISQGFIIPHHNLQPPTLLVHNVNAKIKNQVAEVQVEQIFKNESSSAIEGIFYFPIPKDASVSDFAMWIDGKKLQGELLNRDEARKIYDEIVRRNIDPALLEYAGYRFFRINIFPIPSRGERKIELKYSQFLQLDRGLVRFQYPLHGEAQLGRSRARPMPQPLSQKPQVPFSENEIKTNQRENFSQLFELNIDSEVPIKNIYSPSHDVEISKKSDHHAHVSYEGSRSMDEGDFVLYYSVATEDLGLSLVCHKERGEDGFFLLLVSPKVEMNDHEILDKDIIFVLDTSGSMAGEKIEQAKAALEYCINQLNPNDRFALVTFSSEVKRFYERLVRGRKEKRKAISFIRELKAKGSTNIDEALKTALSYKADKNRLMSIVFLTDGLPTIGTTDVNAIVKHVEESSNGQRIFSFGVGYDVNTFLLDEIAKKRRGVSDYIAPDENIEEKVSIFFDKVSAPVLSDLDLDFGDVDVTDVFPKRLPDLFQGAQLMVVGKYKDVDETLVTLSGRKAEKRKDYVYEAEFQNDVENEFLPRLWASRKIAYLVDEVRTHGESEEVRQEIESLSKKYGIMSPFTSYLVQEDKANMLTNYQISATLGASGKSQPKFIGVPQGNPAPMSSSASSAVGKGAVEVSKTMRLMKEAERVAPSVQDNVRFIGGKTFYFRNDEWVDSEYKDEKVVEIKYGDEAYINLLLSYPQIGKYMKLGEKILLKLNEKFVRIGEKGKTNLSEKQLRKIFG